MSPDSLECKELEKQTLEITELQREATLDENEHKISWKKWFKNPDFYKVRDRLCEAFCCMLF